MFDRDTPPPHVRSSYLWPPEFISERKRAVNETIVRMWSLGREDDGQSARDRLTDGFPAEVEAILVDDMLALLAESVQTVEVLSTMWSGCNPTRI